MAFQERLISNTVKKKKKENIAVIYSNWNMQTIWKQSDQQKKKQILILLHCFQLSLI